MQGPPSNQQPQGEYGVLATITRQLERLDERTRDIATRADLEALRKDVVARDLLEPQLGLLKAQIARLNEDRITDRKEFEKRIDELENDTLSRSDRLCMRLSVAAAILAFLLSLFEFLIHLRIT